MGDLEYEALQAHLEELPQHFRAAKSTYTLVHAITPLEENKSFLEKVQLGERLCGIAEDESFILDRNPARETKDIQKRIGEELEDSTLEANNCVQDTWRNSPTWDFLLQRSPRLQNDPGSDSDTEKCARQHTGEDFPSGGASESDNDIISNEDRMRIMETERRLVEEKKERYLLDYLGSVQCAMKGVEIIVQSVIKMTQAKPGEPSQRTPCILEISDKGIKMVDKSKPGDGSNGVPSNEYFYNLKNVTFCGFHPRDHRYFGFITKHPSPCLQKYACHVFVGESSTRCVAQAYGRAFRRFYQKFIETAFPTEDIYLE